jgi:hypothetical protein
MLLNRSALDPNNQQLAEPEHAILRFGSDGWSLENRDRKVRTYRYINAPLRLMHGDIVLIGNGLFKFRTSARSTADSRATVNAFPGSMPYCKLVPVLADGSPGKPIEYRQADNEIGRENLDPQNNTISRNHCTLNHRNGDWYLTDVSTFKVTFIRADTPLALAAQDVIMLGDMRLRIEPV